jgi:uncharacterized membrane protein
MTQHTQQDSNGLAIASLVLGILSVTGASILTGIPAIITGAMALKNPVNKGMGLAGLIMGAISVFFAVIIMIFIVILIFAGAFAASSMEAEDTPGYINTPESDSYQRRT